MKLALKLLFCLSIILLSSLLLFACDATNETDVDVREEVGVFNEDSDNTYVTINDLEFVLNDTKDSYHLKKVSDSFVGDEIIIPSTVNNLPVTAIDNSGLKVFSQTIKSVTIPNTVVCIGNRAFSSCKALESIVIPDSVKEIGNAAFENCDSLKSVTIGKGVTVLNYNTFAYCKSLETIFIPVSVTYIDHGAFDSCSALKNITIGDGTFQETTTLEIDGYAFYRSTSIETLTIQRNNVKIDDEIFDNLFKDEESLKEAYILGDNIEIGFEAFREQTELEIIVLGKGVTKIGSNAFSGCLKSRLKIFCEAESMPDGWDVREDDANFYWSNEWEYIDGVPTVK